MTVDPEDGLRWLTDDVAARAQAQHRRDLDVEVSDLVPAEWVAVSLTDRLQSARGRTVTAITADGSILDASVVEVGENWLLLRNASGDTVLALAELSTLSGVLPPTISDKPAQLLGQGVLWREWARSRRRARWALIDGRVITGSVRRVGSDALDLAQHPLDRAATAADPLVLVPFGAVRWAASSP